MTITYTELFKSVYSDDGGVGSLNDQDMATQKAWAVMRALDCRKGFDWWFGDLDKFLQDEIFDEIRTAIEKLKE